MNVKTIVRHNNTLRWTKLKQFQGNPNSSFANVLQSATDGDGNAFSQLAYLYELGNCDPGDGVDIVDYQLAFTWYSRAYYEVRDVWGAIGLGQLYYYGHGVDIDYEKALKYFQEAEYNNIGHVYLMLGKMYHLGRGVKIDLRKAKTYFSKAKDLGNIPAINNLGLVEQELGHFFKGLFFRLFATIKANVLPIKDLGVKRMAN